MVLTVTHDHFRMHKTTTAYPPAALNLVIIKTRHPVEIRGPAREERHYSVTVEPQYNEGQRDWQNIFAVTRFRCIEALFLIQ